MSPVVARTRTRVLALAFCLTACVGAAMGFAVVASEQGKITATQRDVAKVLLGSILHNVAATADRRGDMSRAQLAINAGIALTTDMHRGWLVRVRDGDGHVLAAAPPGSAPSWPSVMVRAPLPGTEPPGLELVVTVEDTTQAGLQTMLLSLLAGLAIGLCAGLELLRWLFARGIDMQMSTITATALAGIQGDYRRSPGLGDASELGALQTALARFLSYVTLQRQEVTLMLQDARRDTYDPGLVARAGGWLERLGAIGRFAPDALGIMPMQGDAGLQRLLCFLAALLLGLNEAGLASPPVLAATLAAVLAAGRIGTPLARWIGRRGAILLTTPPAIAALLLWGSAAPAAGLVISAAIISMIVRAASTGDAEPAGAAGLDLDAGAVTGIAGGLAVAATVLLLIPESMANGHHHLLPWGVALIALVAVAALHESITPLPSAALPNLDDVAGLLPNARLCGVIALLVMPISACASLLLRAALAAPSPVHGLLAAAFGAWLAAVLAPRLHRVPGFALCSRLGAGLALIGAAAMPPGNVSWLALAGLGVGILWHGAAAALYGVARAENADLSEQISLRLAYGLRAVAIILPLLVPAPTAMLGGLLIAGGVLAALFHRMPRPQRLVPPAPPAIPPVA